MAFTVGITPQFGKVTEYEVTQANRSEHETKTLVPRRKINTALDDFDILAGQEEDVFGKRVEITANLNDEVPNIYIYGYEAGNGVKSYTHHMRTEPDKLLTWLERTIQRIKEDCTPPMENVV